jgi:hypothetical protein
MRGSIDVRKIFLTPPNTVFERIALIFVMVATFIIFFRPLTFTQMGPIEAVLTAAMPTLSLSWGWIVFLRSVFRKKEFMK